MKTLRFWLCLFALNLTQCIPLQAMYCISETIRENILVSGREDVLVFWYALEASGGALEWEHATPAEREACVFLQACIERAFVSGLRNRQLLITGVVHTPLPPTPLRIAADRESPPGSLRFQRSQILRDFLGAEGCLIAAYSKKCLASNTLDLRVFQSLQRLYPNLINEPCFDTLHDEWIGASYLISKVPHDQCFFFSIKTPQTHEVGECMPLGIWFGPLSAPKVAERYYQVTSFLAPVGIDLKMLLSNQLIWGPPAARDVSLDP